MNLFKTLYTIFSSLFIILAMELLSIELLTLLEWILSNCAIMNYIFHMGKSKNFALFCSIDSCIFNSRFGFGCVCVLFFLFFFFPFFQITPR